jgi:hypothetical protein
MPIFINFCSNIKIFIPKISAETFFLKSSPAEGGDPDDGERAAAAGAVQGGAL